MSKARDISNLFSASTDISTDAEVNSAIANHAASTTNRHYKAGNTSSRPESPNIGDLYTNTETGFIEIYESTGWSTVGAAASIPTSIVATDSGSERAYNNGAASVAFSAGSVAGKTYTITSSPGSYTATGASSPVTVTGLQSATEYTFTATATNNYGTSAASAASAGVTATTVPQAPTIGTATGADQSATLTFTAGATGGSSITNYKYSTDNSSYTAFDPAQTSSPLAISGLTNGQSYSFYLKAVNANGDSAASAASNSVEPGIAGDFQSIATVTVTGGQGTVTFNSISSAYTHLQLRGIARSGDGAGLTLRLNNDSGSNYTRRRLIGNGTAASSLGSTNNNGVVMLGNAGLPSGANTFGFFIIDILDYKNTNKYKTVKVMSGRDSNGSGGVDLTGSAWMNTSAISRIDLIIDSGNFEQYSHFALYGIKGE